MTEPDIANRPTRMLEAGALFSVAINAIRDLGPSLARADRDLRSSVSPSLLIALESFVNEMTEQAQNMSPTAACRSQQLRPDDGRCG
jgi:hypothetical protein